MLISDLGLHCNRLSIAHSKLVLKGLGLTLCGLLISGCNPGLIKMGPAEELDTAESMDAEKKKVIPNPKIDSGYLNVDAMYMAPGHSELPSIIKYKKGKALTTMCISGLKYVDNSLSSIVSLKIGANGAIDNKSIPISGFILKRSGSECELVEENKQVTNAYPVEKKSVQIHYGIRSSSGAEVPIKDIQDAIRVIGPAVSPGTFVFRIATDTVLQNVGSAANENLKNRLKTELSESRSVTASPLSKSQAFFIPLQFQREEENTLVGFIRIQTSLNPSIFTLSTTNGFPDYSIAVVKDLFSQSTDKLFSLKDLVLKEKNIINSDRNMGAASLNQNCERIANDLSNDFALTRSDRAFVINKILTTHSKYNKPVPDHSKAGSERLETLKDLKSFTDLECLSDYRDILDEPAYGLKSKLIEYNTEIASIIDGAASSQTTFNNSTYLLNELAAALNSTDQVNATRILSSNFLDTSSEITIENSVVDSGLYNAGIDPIAKMSNARAAETLISRLSPGRIGCFIGLSNERLRANLFASGFQAYALYKSQDPSIGYKGWMRIIISHFQTQADSKPLVSRLSLSRPAPNESIFLIDNVGNEGVNSDSCKKLLQEYQTQAI